MIELTNLSGTPFFLNADLIETIENIPETKITLTNGRYYLVSEKRQAVVDKVIGYRRLIFAGILAAAGPDAPKTAEAAHSAEPPADAGKA